jgi:hypothetical protein
MHLAMHVALPNGLRTSRAPASRTETLSMWLHASPAHIPDGDWVLPATAFGGRSRTHPNGYSESELRWYEPHRVYVFDTGDVDPLHHFGRFGFVRREYYLYEVEPEDLGPDLDVGARTMKSSTCSRARVVRCLHRPEPSSLNFRGC